MSFRKDGNEQEVSIVVTHSWHPGTEFVFHMPKRLPQAALDAETKFLGLKDGEREEAYRVHLIAMVAEMVTREPDGFEDFPRLTAEDKQSGMVNIDPLAERMRRYFDDPSQPELETIIVGAWRAYRAAAVPVAYLKSNENHRARDSQLSGVSGEASPVV